LKQRFLTLLIATATLAGISRTSVASDSKSKDAIVIVSVVPDGAVKAGESVTFTFELDVTLESADEAWLRLGFNTLDDPNRFRMVSQYLLRRGMERVKISAVVKPKDWGRTGEFTANLVIGPKEAEGRFTPSTFFHRAIPIVP
jgi:hypothetical protein